MAFEKLRGILGGNSFTAQNPQQQQIDASPEEIVRAMELTETGGRNIAGKSGEFGVLQFQPGTWQTVTRQLGMSGLPQNPQNERKVAQKKTAQLLQKGFSPGDVAVIWNTSLGGAEKPIRHRGVNKFGQPFDSSAHEQRFLQNLQKVKSGGSKQANISQGFSNLRNIIQNANPQPRPQETQQTGRGFTPKDEIPSRFERVEDQFGRNVRQGFGDLFEFGKDALQFGKGLARGIGREAVGLGLTNPFLTRGERRIELEPQPEDNIVQESLRSLGRFAFGDEALVPLIGEEGEESEASRFASAFGVSEEKARSPLVQSPIGLVFGSLDLFTGGAASGAGKKVSLEIAERLAKASTRGQSARFLKNLKFPDEVIDDVVEKVTKSTDPEDIRQTVGTSLDNFAKRQAAKQGFKVGKNGRKVEPRDIKLEKFNLEPAEVSRLKGMMDDLGVEKRTVQSFDEMRNIAQEMGLRDVDELLDAVKVQSKLSGPQVQALTDTIRRSAKQVTELNQRLIQEPELEDVIRPQLNSAQQTLTEAIEKRVGKGTEFGRGLVAFRLEAQQTMNPVYWLTRARRVKGSELDLEEQAAIISQINQGDRQGLAQFVGLLRKPKWHEQAVTLWKAGLLTSPTTHLANIGGNLTMAGLMTASDIPATTFDTLISLFTGKRTTTFSPRTVAAKIRGAGLGAKQGKDFLKSGIYPEDLMIKWDITRQVNFKNTLADTYTKAIFRSLGAEDLVFRKAAFSEAMEKQAIVTAKNEGLKGSARKARIKELLLEPTNEMVAGAIDAAEFATFTKQNKLADMIIGAKRGGKEFGSGLEIIVPFTKTPTNIAEAIFDFSPAGFARAIWRAIKPSTRSQKDFVERLGRATTGTGLLAIGASLASKGLMTGNLPDKANERADFFAEGKQPHSIKVGASWLRLDRVSPAGNLLALGAELHELGLERSGLDLVSAEFAAGLKNLSEQTFLLGLSRAVGAVTEPERKGEKFIELTASGIIPTIAARGARTIDPNLRVSDTLLETLKNRIPGLTGGQAPRRDIFGNVAPVPGGKANLIDPFASTKETDSPVLKEAKEVGFVIGLPSQTQNGIRLTEREFSFYQGVQGKILEESLKALIETDTYKNMTLSEKEKAFEVVRRDVRSQLNPIIFPEIMKSRYDLPEDTNPEALVEVMKIWSQSESFKNASRDKQKKAIESLLEQIQ